MKIDDNAVVFSLSANPDLAKSVAEILNTKLGDVYLNRFPSKEVLASPNNTVRGKQCFIIQSTCPPVNDNLMEVLVFIDSLRRASAGEINVIIPYFGYARQDRKSKPREPITAKLVADLLVTAGADRVVTFDLHASQEQGFFSCLEDDLSAIPLIGHVLYNDPEIDKENVVIVSPDHGGVNRARKVAEKLNAPLAIIDKRRNNKYQPEVMNIIGGVEGKDCVLIDDMIDTAGTVVAAANALKANGAKRVMMCAVHPVLSDPAYERLTTSHVLDKLIVTDSIPLDRRFVDNKDIRVQVISLAPHIAAIIDSINHDTSISVTSNMYKD